MPSAQPAADHRRRRCAAYRAFLEHHVLTRRNVAALASADLRRIVLAAWRDADPGLEYRKVVRRQSITRLHHPRAVTQSAARDGNLVDRHRRAARCRRGMAEQRRVERGRPPPSVLGDASTELLD